ncbi:C-type mannose receptor 2-like, partial [Silurus asotus]
FLLLCDMALCQIREYILVAEAKTWGSAQKYCRENYVDLATITTNEENQRLRKNAAASNILDSWIGLNKIVINSDIWQWSDGESGNFFKWSPDQPDNFNENETCVIMSLKGWNDVVCTFALPFFCSWRFVLVNDEMKLSIVFVLLLCGMALCQIRENILVSETKTWDSAQRYCRENYVDLATITTNEENQMLIKSAAASNIFYFWIGLHRIALDLDIWQWSDGESANFFSWNPYQPDNYKGKEGVVIMSQKGWTDVPYTRIYPFFCSWRFVLVNNSKTWEEAHEYCRTYYTGLASPISKAQLTLAGNVLAQTQTVSVWTGLHFVNGQWINIWQWSDGEQANFFNWMSKQPDNYKGNENCVIMNLNGWNDLDCKNANSFYCFWRFVLVTDKYIFMQNAMNWASAQTYCRTNYMDLATVSNDEENQGLVKAAAVSKSLYNWIGMNRTEPGLNIWQWSDGEPVNYCKWSSGQPNNYNGIENCATVSPGGWHDVACANALPFLCFWRIVLVNESKTWEEAREYCRMHYTGLFSPISEEQLAQAANVI